MCVLINRKLRDTFLPAEAQPTSQKRKEPIKLPTDEASAPPPSAVRSQVKVEPVVQQTSANVSRPATKVETSPQIESTDVKPR